MEQNHYKNGCNRKTIRVRNYYLLLKIMKRIKFLGIVLISSALLSSCSMIMPVATTSNPTGSKVGTATAYVVFGLYFEEDASIGKAAKAGGITKISTVDQKRTDVLGFFQTYETIVTGE